MSVVFEGWIKSDYFLDPIPPSRRKNPKFTGNSRAACGEIFKAISYLEHMNATQRYVWRGQSNINWKLSTSLERYILSKNPHTPITPDTFRKEEKAILAEARDRGIGKTEAGRTRILHTYAELQHFGVPTKLLDVTEDALTALWFASQSSKFNSKNKMSKNEQDGILFAFDVSKLTRMTTSDPDPTATKQSAKQKNLKMKPIYLTSEVPNRRMIAQRAAFILSQEATHSRRSGAENFVFGPFSPLTTKDREDIRSGELKTTSGSPRKIPFIAILVPHESKSWILNKLESNGKRTEPTLFPDILGLAKKYSQ